MPKSLAVARYAYVFCHASSKKYPTQSASLIFLQFLKKKIVRLYEEEGQSYKSITVEYAVSNAAISA